MKSPLSKARQRCECVFRSDHYKRKSRVTVGVEPSLLNGHEVLVIYCATRYMHISIHGNSRGPVTLTPLAVWLPVELSLLALTSSVCCVLDLHTHPSNCTIAAVICLVESKLWWTKMTGLMKERNPSRFYIRNIIMRYSVQKTDHVRCAKSICIF